MPKDGSSADGPGGSQDQIGSRSKTSANNEEKLSLEGGPEGDASEINKARGEKIETRIEVRTSSQQLPNQSIQFLRV
jgi:hypothetical protein